jgi:hypothetical protein
MYVSIITRVDAYSKTVQKEEEYRENWLITAQPGNSLDRAQNNKQLRIRLYRFPCLRSRGPKAMSHNSKFCAIDPKAAATMLSKTAEQLNQCPQFADR